MLLLSKNNLHDKIHDKINQVAILTPTD